MNETNEQRFRILVCIDGSDESYRGLRYAALLGEGADADMVLLYVRPVDQGLRSGGLQVRLARENIRDWGIELPGMRHLKKGRDILVEAGYMAADRRESFTRADVDGDPLGDFTIEYFGSRKRRVLLELKVATDIASGVLDEAERRPTDLIVLGASERWRKRRAMTFWDPAVAEKVALHAPCSVLIARELSLGRGHLVCTDGSERAMDMVRKDAFLAAHCDCPIALLSVALSPDTEAEAVAAVNKARDLLKSMDIEADEMLTRVGDPVEEIIELGPDYSLIALSDTGKSGLTRFFMGSVAFKVMERAYNSVMIVR